MELDRLPYDLFKPLWDLFYSMFDDGSMFSVKEVWLELKDSQDVWKDYEDCFRELNDSETEHMTCIMSSDKFKEFIHNGQKSNDEPWQTPFLIACAMDKNEAIIITEENLNNNPKRKIPYVCEELNEYGFNIKCLNLFDFLRYNKITFKITKEE